MEESWFPIEMFWMYHKIKTGQPHGGRVRPVFDSRGGRLVAICIKIDEFCIKNDETFIKRDGFCIQNDGFYY